MKTAKVAPDYGLYRELDAADGAGPHTDKGQGINLGGFHYAHVQVIPDGGATDVQVMFWSEEAGQFIEQDPDIAFAAKADPFEFTVEARGRIMFVACRTNPAKVLVSAFDPRGHI